LRLRNFRQYKDQTIKFSKTLNLISGRNNAGKTSIFYAIAYGLFGAVDGFSNLRYLCKFGEHDLGVECIFKVQDGNFYKLQRVHKFGEKSTTTQFNLSRIEEHEEKIMISSDFDHSVDDFNQKIIELIGFNKKYFDLVIFFKQGELLPILKGDKGIDLILGITTLNEIYKAIGERMGELMLDFSQLVPIADEKRVLLQELKAAQEVYEMEVGSHHEYAKRLHALKASLELYTELQIKEKSDAIDNTILDMLAREKESVEKRGVLKTIEAEFESGSIDVMRTAVDAVNVELADLAKEEEATRQDLDGINADTIKKRVDHGRLKDLIEKRESVKDVMECPLCGAPVSINKMQDQLSHYHDELANVERELERLGVVAREKRDAIAAIAKQKDGLRKGLLEKQQDLKKREADEGRRSRMQDEIAALDKASKEKRAMFLKKINELKESVRKMPDSFEMSWPLEGFITKTQGKPEIAKVNVLWSEIRGKFAITELKREIELYKSFKQDAERREKENENVLNNKKARMAVLDKKERLIKEKQDAYDRYKALQKDNSAIQTRIREASVKLFSASIMDYYNLLSDQDEFVDTRISPEDYSLEVLQKGKTDFIPAYIYEGGGQKLILSLAYKFALGSIFQQPMFILADEPTYGADTKNRANILEKLKTFPHSFQLNLITHQNLEIFEGEHVINVRKEENTTFVEGS
jgi:exonuclease SbcC